VRFRRGAERCARASSSRAIACSALKRRHDCKYGLPEWWRRTSGAIESGSDVAVPASTTAHAPPQASPFVGVIGDKAQAVPPSSLAVRSCFTSSMRSIGRFQRRTSTSMELLHIFDAVDWKIPATHEHFDFRWNDGGRRPGDHRGVPPEANNASSALSSATGGLIWSTPRVESGSIARRKTSQAPATV
jgi:hypothetical protein